MPLSFDGKAVRSGRIPKPELNIYSGVEIIGVGIDSETVVTKGYTHSSSRFTGKFEKATISAKP